MKATTGNVTINHDIKFGYKFSNASNLLYHPHSVNSQLSTCTHDKQNYRDMDSGTNPIDPITLNFALQAAMMHEAVAASTSQPRQSPRKKRIVQATMMNQRKRKVGAQTTRAEVG